MTLQEQIFQASEAYEKSRWSHGVIDPVVLDEIGDAYYQGAEYGYKLAVEKAVEWLSKEYENIGIRYIRGCSPTDEIEQLKKAMENENK